MVWRYTKPHDVLVLSQLLQGLCSIVIVINMQDKENL